MKTITLNTGQEMPLINLGGTAQSQKAGNHYSNYSEWLKQGGRGLDTALTYTDEINKQIAAAIEAIVIVLFYHSEVVFQGQGHQVVLELFGNLLLLVLQISVSLETTSIYTPH